MVSSAKPCLSSRWQHPCKTRVWDFRFRLVIYTKKFLIHIEFMVYMIIIDNNKYNEGCKTAEVSKVVVLFEVAEKKY